MRMPTPATAIMVTPSAGSGDCSRSTASQPSDPIATSSSTALTNAATMLARLRP
jgi:hypothetical protein